MSEPTALGAFLARELARLTATGHGCSCAGGDSLGERLAESLRSVLGGDHSTPHSDEEWAEAIDDAVFCLALSAAESVFSDLAVGADDDVDRAEALLLGARAAGRPIPFFDELLERLEGIES